MCAVIPDSTIVLVCCFSFIGILICGQSAEQLLPKIYFVPQGNVCYNACHKHCTVGLFFVCGTLLLTGIPQKVLIAPPNIFVHVNFASRKKVASCVAEKPIYINY